MVSADPKFVKITFGDGDGDSESLWAIDLGDGAFKLDSTPWFQYGVSWRDIVEAEPDRSGLLCFTRIKEKSGHRTLRARSENPIDQAVLDAITSAGCSYEGATPKYIAIDAPPEVELSAVVRALDASGLEWEYADPPYEEVHGSEG